MLVPVDTQLALDAERHEGRRAAELTPSRTDFERMEAEVFEDANGRSPFKQLLKKMNMPNLEGCLAHYRREAIGQPNSRLRKEARDKADAAQWELNWRRMNGIGQAHAVVLELRNAKSEPSGTIADASLSFEKDAA